MNKKANKEKAVESMAYKDTFDVVTSVTSESQKYDFTYRIVFDNVDSDAIKKIASKYIAIRESDSLRVNSSDKEKRVKEKRESLENAVKQQQENSHVKVFAENFLVSSRERISKTEKAKKLFSQMSADERQEILNMLRKQQK